MKRITNDPRVELQPSNSRGVVEEGSSGVSGTAAVVSGDEFEQVRDLVKSKYGVMYHLMIGVGKIQALFKSGFEPSNSAVVITLDAPGSGEDAAE